MPRDFTIKYSNFSHSLGKKAANGKFMIFYLKIGPDSSCRLSLREGDSLHELSKNVFCGEDGGGYENILLSYPLKILPSMLHISV